MKITHFAWLSIAAAVATIILKTGAYLATGSVGLLSDALESLVNLVAAITALSMLHIAQRPPDEDHAYGHTKAEYFSSTIEGILIMVAALSIGIAAINRLIHPKDIELEKIEFGIHKRLDKVTVFTHLEPREDPRSMDNVGIDRS